MDAHYIVKTCIGEIEDDAFETSIYIIHQPCKKFHKLNTFF
jgi:hypothetical protein